MESEWTRFEHVVRSLGPRLTGDRRGRTQRGELGVERLLVAAASLIGDAMLELVGAREQVGFLFDRPRGAELAADVARLGDEERGFGTVHGGTPCVIARRSSSPPWPPWLPGALASTGHVHRF